ncbi:hypothetical protein D9V32_14090 [Mycetocola tolaasinivorans]|uniref:Uncharacterized protein n=1 Tax=Mycetocola tolaasinivorans TaxID=76635 RepID=A0A3L7A0L6_9MICO|nr:hypothetical protein [Mycetocola tolaasinivorans]RLP73657.1 hypothetical protein D9V32_14090 [Mycetocola tolaasinivorans]
MSRRSVWWLLGLVIAVLVVLALLAFGGRWGQKALDTVGPDNVSKQYAVIIENWQSLSVTADNACLAQSAASGAGSPTLVESPALAYAATYRNVAARYNAAFADVFKAGLVGPPGYPREIPSYPEAVGASPDFCAVSSNLAMLRASH